MSGILVNATLVPEKFDISRGRLPIVILSLPKREFIISMLLDKSFLFFKSFSTLLFKFSRKLI